MVSLEFLAPQLEAAFGDAVKEHRNKLGLTQEKLQDASGIAQNSISRTECGDSNMTYFNLRKLAQALKIPAWKLLQRAEEIERQNGVVVLPADESSP